MKYLLLATLCLFPLSSFAAAQLTVCDDNTYTVIVNNGGQKREVTMTKNSGEIEEFGPLVSFQIKAKKGEDPYPIMVNREPYVEYCIWSGSIKIQRLNTTNSGGAGGHF